MAMTSYTFNFNGKRITRLRLIKLFLLTLALVTTGFLLAEAATRYHYNVADSYSQTVQELVEGLPAIRISGREIGNQTLAQNVSLFSQNTAPQEVVAGYVGTSRSKILQPSRLGIGGTVVGAGNSYSEISYGLLLQAEILRLRFPKLKTVYVESSLLLRRPARLIVEPDHLKYMPLLKSLAPLCAEPILSSGCTAIFQAAESLTSKQHFTWKPELPEYRSQLRISSLFSAGDGAIRAAEDPLLKGLTTSGERRDALPALTSRNKTAPEVTNDNIKVQRLRDIPANAPWDGLFDMFAEWGKAHQIQIVYFQPPVRSDLYKFQTQFGLREHVSDLKRISKAYGIPFIDLDTPEAELMQDWSLFSDEDHMGTCTGSALLVLALEQGLTDFMTSHELEPSIRRPALDGKLGHLGVCKASE
jgi:hypothetical protein